MASVKFSDISEAAEMVSYLKDAQRFNSIQSFSKYMKVSSAIDMFHTGMMLINNPVNMNDLYEYRAFNPAPKWSKICFSSFITQSTESMAMWSMYAQPWAEGVMISVPTLALKELIKNTRILICAETDAKTHRYFPGSEKISADGIINITRVAYVDGETITCTGRDDRNTKLKNPYATPELAGYLKDGAWSYEKEMRIRVDLPSEYKNNAVYIKLPEEFLRQITIITGPRFAGNMLISLPEQYRPHVQIRTSKFKEKLAWIPCDTCKHKE